MIAFFVLAYIISWIAWAPLLILPEYNEIFQMVGGFGPTISAIIITYIISGSKGLKSQADRIISWRASPVWCLFVLFSPAAIVLLAIGIYVMIGGTVPQFNDPAQWYLIPIAFSYVFVFTALGEEPGWRGFALPGLQSGSNALKSSLILGVIWGTWHLPLFLMKGNFHNQVHLTAFMVQIIAMTVLYTWIYNNTNGNLFLASVSMRPVIRHLACYLLCYG